MTRFGFVAAAGLGLLPLPAAAQIQATSGETAATVTTQLPRTVRPDHYDVTITPDAKALTFSGKETIDIAVIQPTGAITLQAANIAFGTVTLAAADGKSLGKGAVALDKDKQTATFSFGKSIAAGTYRLAIEYTGTINTQANGLFALDYKAADGSAKRALYTQFENSDARKFIPSWDEPFYKATFSLKAIVPDGEMAISNLPVKSRAPAGPGKTLVTFGDSPKMSTYLLFFGLGDFERATKMAGATEIGVITKRGDLSQAQFGLDAASKILPWYNDYFGTPFPLPKLDHIAGPGQSQFFGAMENWGAIFYFESEMLLDPKIASSSDKQNIFTVFAHEMAHQWFGDLVTMSWWDDLWLNEGFASWMEGRASQHFHPEWNPELDAVGSRNGAMNQDALVTTHPIVHHVATVEEASQAFDSITYNKGEAVIAMLEAYTGADAWRDGVRRYMQRYAHSNTVTDDLWREIEGVSGKAITQIAHDFTLQPGIPLVKVSGTCSGGATALTLDQGEFTRDRPDKIPLSWHVPVIAATLGGKPTETLLAGHGTLSVPGCAPVIVNAGQSGYYRTLYTPALFAGIAKAFAQVKPIDQLGILADASALGLAGLQPVSDVLDLAQNLPADAQPQVIESAAGLFLSLYTYSEGVPARQAALTRFATARLLPVLVRLGWQPKAGESDNDANLRDTLIRTLGYAGEPSVLAEVRRRFAASATDPSAIPPSLRVAMLIVVARNADQATWDKLHVMARAEQSAQVKTLLYTVLGMPKDAKLAQAALTLALTSEPGATTSPGIVGAVARLHSDMAFDFAIAHLKEVMAMVDSSAASRFVPQLGAGSFDPAMIGKIGAYAKANLPPSAARSADEAIATIQYRVMVRDKRMPAVDAWLAANRYGLPH